MSDIVEWLRSVQNGPMNEAADTIVQLRRDLDEARRELGERMDQAAVHYGGVIRQLKADNETLRGHRFTEIKTVDAIEKSVVDAMTANDGWELLHAGMGSGGQTTLTWGWPSRLATPDTARET